MIPQTTDKQQFPPLLDGKKMLAHRRQHGLLPTFEPPDMVIFCYHRPLLSQFRWRSKRVEGFFGETYLLKKRGTWGRSALVGNFGVGAPALAVLLEEWAAFGVKRFVSVGMAGAIQPHLQAGDVMFCQRALRDEGTSHHYDASAARYAEATSVFTQRLIQKWPHPHHAGASWTTDAPYRETRPEVDAYAAEGILTVEMEAAALFTVGNYLGVETAAILVVGDRVTPTGWTLDFDHKLVDKRLRQVVDFLLINRSKR